MELFPVVCYTCGKALSQLQVKYEKLLEEGVPIDEAMDRLGVLRSCCRTRVMNPDVYAPGVQMPSVKTVRITKGQPKMIEPKNVIAVTPKKVQKPQLPPVEAVVRTREVPVRSSEPVEKPKITVPPLNLQGVNFKSLSEIAIPTATYL